MKRLVQFCAFAPMLLASACATISTKSNGSWGSPYSGAQCSAHDFMSLPPVGPIEIIAMALDVPLSTIVDTLVLPADLIMLEDERYVPCEAP